MRTLPHLTRKPSCLDPISSPSVPTVHACIDSAAASNGAAPRMPATTSGLFVNNAGARVTTTRAAPATARPIAAARRIKRTERRRAAGGARGGGCRGDWAGGAGKQAGR